MTEFTERERGLAEPDVPQALVWRQLRGSAQREEEARAALRDQWRRRAELAAEVSRIRNELARFRADSATALAAAGVDADVLDADVLAVLDERLGAALGRAGFHAHDPCGRPWAEVRAWADALPGAPPGDDHLVTETVEPAVTSDDGELVARALVVLGLPDQPNGLDEGEGT